MARVVTLSTDEVRVCTVIAVERWFMKRDSVDRPNYAAGKAAGLLEHELLANIRANVTEYAVSKLYSRPWTMPWYPNEEHPRRKDHPDVGSNIEVRTIRTRSEVPVWQKDVSKGAVIVGGRVLDDAYYSQVEIFGWLKASDCVRSEWLNVQDSSWRVPIAAFNDFDGG